MKPLFTVAALFYFGCCSGQVFYKSMNDNAVEELLENGIVYINSGNDYTDELYANALEENWKSTKYEIYDVEENEEKLDENRIVFFEASMSDYGRVLAMVPLKVLTAGTFSKYSTIGYIYMDGFNQADDTASRDLFIDFLISGLDDVVSSIRDNNISGQGVGLYSRISKSFTDESVRLKSKILLLVGESAKLISTSGLEKSGIKYKKVTSDEFKEIMEGDRSGYTLFYFGYNDYTEVSFFDLETTDLLYTVHYMGAKISFTTADIGKIVKSWE